MKIFDFVFGPGLRPSTLRDAAFPPEARSGLRVIPALLRALHFRRPTGERPALDPAVRAELAARLGITAATYSLLIILGAWIMTGGGAYMLPGVATTLAGVIPAGTALYQRRRLLREGRADAEPPRRRPAHIRRIK